MSERRANTSSSPGAVKAPEQGNVRDSSAGRTVSAEQALYAPVKVFLEAQGYAVKGEIDGCDIVAIRGSEPPVIVELKKRFTLALVLQGIARQGLADDVYLAVPPFSGHGVAQRDAMALCRRLGLGLLIVLVESTARVDALLDPAPYRPRKRPQRLGRLLREFQRRVGDPSPGGSVRSPIMTAYRQDALRCAAHLGLRGPTKAATVAQATGVAKAGHLLRADHYGWFERAPETRAGIYRLTPKGSAALEEHAGVVASLTSPDSVGQPQPSSASEATGPPPEDGSGASPSRLPPAPDPLRGV